MQGLQTPFSARRGVGVYIEGIVRHLQNLRGHDVRYLFNAEFPDQYFQCLHRLQDIVTRERSHLFAQNIIDGYHSTTEQKIRVAERYVSAVVESLEPDVFFSPNLQEGLHDKAVTAFAAYSGRFAQVATLHDMVPMYMEEYYLEDPGTRRWYTRKIADAARCDTIVTVSESSKEDIRRFLGSTLNVEAIPNGFDPDRFNAAGSPRERKDVADFLHCDQDYILYVGGSDQHKNIARLVSAYASLPDGLRRRFALVLGGSDVTSSKQVFAAIKEHDLDRDVILPGYVSDDMLPPLLRQAHLFIFPSLHEGFGLPALEAMACGTPTIGSATSAVGEVIADPDATFDPLQVDDIARLIRRSLESESWRRTRIEKGLKRASEYSWRGSAERLLDVLEEAHAGRLRGQRLSYLSKRVAEVLPSDDPALARAAAMSIAETATEARPRRIYVDVSSTALYGGHSGIQRVVRELARYLPDTFARLGAEVQPVYAEEGTTDLRMLSSIMKDGSWHPDARYDRPVDLAAGDILIFIDLHPGLAMRMEHKIQRLRARGIQVFHVVYDVLPVLMPEKFWPELQEEFYRWLECVSRSDGLLCISRAVAAQTSDYLQNFGVKRPDPLRVGHFPLGSNFNEQATGSPGDLSDTFRELRGNHLNFLTVGTLEPRKAQEQALLAFEQAWAQGESWHLILVGRQGWKVERLAHYIREHSELGRRLFWFDAASDELLRALYDLADCVICPSEGEGFGLPLIEAAHAKKPVIARDIPVFREVATPGTRFFPDDRSPTVLKRAVSKWVAQYQPINRADNMESRPSSWAQSAEEFVSALRRDAWPFLVQAKGALDLRNPVTLANANLSCVGTYSHEGRFVWTASRASVGFQTIESYASIHLKLDCHSWRDMPFDLLWNGQRVFSGSVGEKAMVFEMDLPETKPGSNRLEILSKEASSPPNDSRILGIAIRELKMFANHPIKLSHWVNVCDQTATWPGFSAVKSGCRSITGQIGGIHFRVERSLCAAILLFVQTDQPINVAFLLNGEEVDEQFVPIGMGTINLGTVQIPAGKNALDIRLLDAPSCLKFDLFEFMVSPPGVLGDGEPAIRAEASRMAKAPSV